MAGPSAWTANGSTGGESTLIPPHQPLSAALRPKGQTTMLNTTDHAAYRTNRWDDADAELRKLGKLADKVARQHFRKRGTAGAPFEWTDLSQELLAYVLDDDAQRAKGYKIRAGDDDDTVSGVLGYIARDWFAELTGERSAVEAQEIGIPLAEDALTAERVVRDDHAREIDRLNKWDAEAEADAAIAAARLEKRLRAVNAAVKPPGPAMRWVARAFANERDPWFAAQRRLLGRALIGQWLDGRGDDVRLIVHKFRATQRLNAAQRKRLGRAVERVVIRINRDLSQEPYGRRTHAQLSSGHLGDGPGSRRVLSNAEAQAIAQNQYDPQGENPRDVEKWAIEMTRPR